MVTSRFIRPIPPGCLIISMLITSWCDAADFQFGTQILKNDALVTRINQEELAHQTDAKAAKPEPAVINGDTIAYLWVPPKSKRLRGVMLCPANIIERRIAEDPIIRAQAERDDLAIVFFNGGWKGSLTDSQNLVVFIEALLARLGEKSGYDELATVPWIPVGHSGNSVFAGCLSRLKPERTLATIIIKGNGFHVVGRDATKPPTVIPANVTTVPLLWISGEFEEVGEGQHRRNGWWLTNRTNFGVIRHLVPQATVALICDRGHGHIDWQEGISTFTALFIHHAMAARNPDGSGLKPIVHATGWLVDPYGQSPAAPVATYQGDPALAGWLMDEELAKAWTAIMTRTDGKQEQLLGFTSDGTPTGPIADWWNGWALQCIDFKPLDDGVTFRVAARFHDEVPKPFADAGTKLGHGDPSKIRYQVTGWAGNLAQVGPDLFRVRFDREGVNGRTTHVVLAASHPGDATYRDTMVMTRLQIPYNNKDGAAQTIIFPAIPNTPVTTSTIDLKATVSSPLHPDYYVSWGPAEVDGDHLVLTPIPSRAKFPIEVKVTAYQWGKGTDPKFATATPVTQTFTLIH